MVADRREAVAAIASFEMRQRLRCHQPLGWGAAIDTVVSRLNILIDN